jgi:hypothetical protein
MNCAKEKHRWYFKRIHLHEQTRKSMILREREKEREREKNAPCPQSVLTKRTIDKQRDEMREKIMFKLNT